MAAIGVSAEGAAMQQDGAELDVSAVVGNAPTPQRQRKTSMGDAAACEKKVSSPQKEAEEEPRPESGHSWPSTFCVMPKGDRLELSEERSSAKRTSGVSHGVAFLGPLSLEKDVAYFELEIEEMEQGRSQTMAIGISSSLPRKEAPLRAERARDIVCSDGSCCILGYDLPKVYVNGREVAKINTKQWRPLKDLAVGSRVGLLIDRTGMELTVFVNGEKMTSAVIAANDRWPDEVWGVVDVHGTVKSVRLRPPTKPSELMATCPAIQKSLTVDYSAALPAADSLAAADKISITTSNASEEAPSNNIVTSSRAPLLSDTTAAGTKDPLTILSAAAAAAPAREEKKIIAMTPVHSSAVALASALQEKATASNSASLRRSHSQAGLTPQLHSGQKRRLLRMRTHSCGCMVHLISHDSSIVHVPPLGDFVIGRNPMSCSMALDSEKVPNMISRRHAVIVSAEDAVMIVDNESTNGTFVNGRSVGRETLRQGDVIVIGNPSQSPAEFRFEVSMPDC